MPSSCNFIKFHRHLSLFLSLRFVLYACSAIRLLSVSVRWATTATVCTSVTERNGYQILFLSQLEWKGRGREETSFKLIIIKSLIWKPNIKLIFQDYLTFRFIFSCRVVYQRPFSYVQVCVCSDSSPYDYVVSQESFVRIPFFTFCQRFACSTRTLSNAVNYAEILCNCFSSFSIF